MGQDSILDALSDAGDLTEFGRRDNVMVIREVDGNKTFTRINLASDSVFSSPCFYLQQNDVVYVEPNKIKIDNSKYNQNNAYKLSTISTVVSMASVISAPAAMLRLSTMPRVSMTYAFSGFLPIISS